MADLWERSQTVDAEVRAYVSSLVNAIGGRSTYDDSYAVGDEAAAVLKDLQRWLRLYDEKTGRHDVKRVLAEANVVRGDLLELLSLWPDHAQANRHRAKLALACLELLVPLTWPVQLDGDTATVNHHRHVPYLQLAQVGYKRAVLHWEHAPILRTAVRVALPALATPKRERSRRDEGIIKLCLYFCRNLAAITQPQHLPSQGDENEVGRSALVDVFHAQDIFSLLLTVGSGVGDEFPEQDVLVLDILFHVLKGVDARKLFINQDQAATEDTSELKNLLRKEKAMLDSYKRHAPTRHNRFGTMIWVQRDDAKLSTVSGQTSMTNEADTLRQMDASKKWRKPLYRGKLVHESDEHSEFGMRIDLTESARKHLRGFVEDFLDSSFNPLFGSVRKAMEREADRVQESVHHKQYFYLVSWFLNAEAARRHHSGWGHASTSTRLPGGDSTCNADGGPTETAPDEDNSFAHIAAVLDQETFVLLNRHMQSAFDNKSWPDLQSTLLCFTQILLTVQSMAESKDEEDQEIAENIQNRIFYEESTHDRIVQILRGYTHQGFAYLDAVTECVHVFIRMLERYSKQNVGLHIRSTRRARTKQQPQREGGGGGGGGGGDGDADDAAEDEREAHRAVSERKFDFAKFAAKFLSQACVNTFISFIAYHRDLTPVQLKRAHRFLYRLAFKHGLAVLLFRVDILQLLHKLIKGPEGLDPGMEGFKEWEQLVQQVFRRCIKWVERPTDGEGWREAAMVEMLFSKIPNTMFYLQNGFEKAAEKRAPRPPAELEMKPSVPHDQRVGIATSMLIEQAQADDLGWVKKHLQEAVEERRAWEEEQAARSGMMMDEDGGQGVAPAVEAQAPPSIFLTADSDDRRLALFKDKHLRLLLVTLGCQRLGVAEDSDAAWIVPSALTASQLQEALEQIKKAEFDPPSFEEDKTAADFIRSKAKERTRTFDDHDDSDTDASGSGGARDEERFPPNLQEKGQAKDGDDGGAQKRKRRAVDRSKEERQERRKAREQKEREKNAKIKSKLFVTMSDDESDAEADAEFFRLEEQRRKKTDGVIRNMLVKQMMGNAAVEEEGEEEEKGDGQSPKGNKKKMKRAKTKTTTTKKKKKKKKKKKEKEKKIDEDEAMLDAGGSESSEHERSRAATRKRRRRSSKVSPIELSDDDDDDDDDDDEPPVAPAAARRRPQVRAGFIIDDDSDDE